ncbi:MAP kinase kinase kinase [Mycena venus]|uniref:MAP kinase kinase kinase n=1 Tax=Mycena venus TaxID=2733690 RepID=A0A8H6XQZ0_9AGAR|nr:MAP kinase kinase kinase [Mycena venus]
MQRTMSMPPPEEEEQYEQYEQYAGPMQHSRDSYDFTESNRESMVAEPPSPQIVTKIGTYPLDAYDAGLIESDRQTWELLRKVNSTNTPSFHNYDTTKGIWPVAQRQGIVNNIKFVRGNFVKQPLPFPDGSFQLVRMASLSLCIPHERWEFVLDQVWRVLAVGGRLEFIDDHVFFPYGKPPQMNPRSQSPPVPTLDTMIPSTVFSRMSLADVVNPSIRDDTDSQIYDLYGVEEEDEYSDADTVASGRRLETPTPHTRSSSRSSRSTTASLRGPHGDPEAWHEQAAAAREARGALRAHDECEEMTSMHLTLAPPEVEGQRPPSLNGRAPGRFERAQTAATAAGADDPLGQCPGLILWPSTFIPMPLPELEAHVAKHLRVLLSCKSALIDYASEIADQGEGDTQSEAAMEALWEYQNFLRERFNPPPDDLSRTMSDASSSTGDANSIHNSIFSVSSVGTEALEAMREYQTYVSGSQFFVASSTDLIFPSELTARFEVPAESSKAVRRSVRDAPTPTRTPPPRSSIDSTVTASSSSSGGSTSAPQKTRRRGSRGRDRSSVVSSIVPPYSRIELTHVRTFYVYEAVKQAQDRFQVGRMI